MGKDLRDMTLEELWELFPIALSKHNSEWPGWAEEEMEYLNVMLSKHKPSINHIGSTAVPGIMAKSIIDILVEIPPEEDWAEIKKNLESHGYICMNNGKNRMSFNKGYTPCGYAARVFHIHIHTTGDNDEIFFRDYLRAHPTVAKEYETLKLSLLPEYKNNRDGYTAAKTGFIKSITAMAKGEK